ncbi:MAG: hypothetical protein E6Q77_08685 [Rhizobium sp.]|nr:MAG: hypothetical protein E6Q77_08685 [Rhizobium sp.]
MSIRKRKWVGPDGETKFAWVVDFKDLGGVRRLRTFRLKKEADRHATKVRAELLDAEFKAKGPATVAAVPDHGSISNEDQKMNKVVSTTATPEKKATDTEVAKAMRSLENAVRELMHMADIAAESYDTIFAPRSRLEKNSEAVTYRLTPHEDDQISFLINDVAARCSKLHKAFDAAWHGEALS